MFKRFKAWLDAPINPDDWFFVNIRETRKILIRFYNNFKNNRGSN